MFFYCVDKAPPHGRAAFYRWHRLPPKSLSYFIYSAQTPLFTVSAHPPDPAAGPAGRLPGQHHPGGSQPPSDSPGPAPLPARPVSCSAGAAEAARGGDWRGGRRWRRPSECRGCGGGRADAGGRCARCGGRAAPGGQRRPRPRPPRGRPSRWQRRRRSRARGRVAPGPAAAGLLGARGGRPGCVCRRSRLPGAAGEGRREPFPPAAVTLAEAPPGRRGPAGCLRAGPGAAGPAAPPRGCPGRASVDGPA